MRTVQTSREKQRRGKVIVMLLVMLPAMLGMVALVFDAGLLMTDRQGLQQAIDAGALAGAMDLRLGKSHDAMRGTVAQYVQQLNGQYGVEIKTFSPPQSGS